LVRSAAGGPVAQWLEPTAHNGLVGGSSPPGPTILRSLRATRDLLGAKSRSEHFTSPPVQLLIHEAFASVAVWDRNVARLSSALPHVLRELSVVDVFKKLDDAKAELNPFPFVVVEDILPEQICDGLLREMPPLDVLTHGEPPGDNKRFNFSYAEAAAAPGISRLWLDVLEQAISQTFLDRILRIFEPSIREFYPDFERRFGPVNRLVAVPRSKKKSRTPNNIMLDAQIAVNTPALTGGTSVRPAHLDRTDKIFVGLLYLRLPNDDSKGADLELLRPKDGQLLYGHQRMLPEDKTIHVRTVPYRRNTLVLFLNSPKSLHGVTPRQVTPHARYFINLVGETAKPLFEVETERHRSKSVAASLLGRIWSGIARERGERPSH
jgi:hypothetical protein